MGNINYLGPASESTWRKMAGASWDGPRDPTIYGLLEIDAGPLQERIATLREEGKRITVTHVIARALAVAIGRHPGVNVVFRRRRAYRRSTVDVFMHVVQPGASGDLGATELSGVMVREADTKTLVDVAEEMSTKVAMVHANEDTNLNRARRTLGAIPRLLLRPVLRLVNWLTVEWNVNLSWAGVQRDPFGSAAVTNVGVLGVDTGFAPLFPLGGPPILVTVGTISLRAVVDDSGQVVARPVLRLGGTFDHRLMDGYHLAKLSNEFVHILEHEMEHL